ncbi:MAG: hypothetical protein NC548_39615 [Lachnospiraceae bacterium]|nr:hypothetical protein [Lachnospiraceae bacterium]
MTPSQVMSAYKAVNELANCAFPYSVTRQVHALKKKLTDEFNTVLEAEKTLVAKHHGTVIENGSYHFETVEAATVFHKEYQDFLNQESDINLPTVDVSRCGDAVIISATSMDALEGLVIFEEG